MRIVVLLKQIPDPNIVEFDIISDSLRSIYWILNPIDLLVLEEGLRIRERHGGKVIAVSIAPERGAEVLNKALRYGADRAVIFWDDILQGADTWVLSGVIEKIIEYVGFDLVLCGSRSADSGSEFMGAALAERLNLPLATNVIKIELQDKGTVQVDRKLERGERETYSFRLPAVIAVEKGVNDPRYVAPYSRTYREGLHRKIEVVNLDLKSLHLDPVVAPVRIIQPRPRTKVGVNISGLSLEDRFKLMRGELGSKKEILRASPEEGAKRIVAKLREWLSL